MLAGIVQSPTMHDPYKRPEDATKRRNVVLGELLSEGYINPETAKTAKSSPSA